MDKVLARNAQPAQSGRPTFVYKSITFFMALKKTLRDLIIGKNRFLASYGEYKQTILSGHIALMAILIIIFYAITDLFLGIDNTLPVYIATVILLIIVIYLHRTGYHKRANYVLLPTINLAVYLFSASESPAVGTLIYFISNSVAAFAVFSYKERLSAVFFSIFTYILFILACFVDFSILPKRPLMEEFLIFQIIINFSFALPTTVMSVYLLINLNHYNASQLVERNDQLKKTNTELDRFVYSTSHDLRAPLTSIMGLLNIINNTDKPDEQRKYLGMMKDRVHSLDKFIKDITDYSRNNRLDIVQEKVKLYALAEEVWESLKFTPEASRIVFNIDIPEEITVDSDKNRLKVIISNLVSNAIRYHDDKKDVQYIRLAAELSDSMFYMRVEDNGQGIAKEYHTKIFDMFYRGNEQSKGSGLGLYIVKEALMKLSGSIHLESAPGIGTIFTVRLPANPVRTLTGA
jgi:signal transduction histidine kinase